MTIYVPTPNNWHYVLHFPLFGYVNNVHRVRPPIIGHVSNAHAEFRLAGYEGIARDDRGRWLRWFVGRLGVVTTLCLTAELWAIHDGLTLGKKFNLKNVIIETDSHEALMLMMSKGGAVDNHLDRELIEECQRLLSEHGISMMHTLREGNCCGSPCEIGKNATRWRSCNTTSSTTFHAPTSSRGHG